MIRTCPSGPRYAIPARSRATTRKTARTPRSSGQGARPNCERPVLELRVLSSIAADLCAAKWHVCCRSPRRAARGPPGGSVSPGAPHSRCFRALISGCAGADDEKKPFKWWKIVPDSERPFWCMACFKSFDTEDEIFEHGTPGIAVFRGYIVCTAGWGVP